jgi:acetolactate synthase-1/2/3 large subunit
MRFESPLKSRRRGHRAHGVGWVRTSASAADVGADGAAAVQATRDGAVGRIATLILPADTAWGDGGRAGVARAAAPAPLKLRRRARRRTRPAAPWGPRAVLLLGAGGSGSERALHLAAAIAAAPAAV